MTELFKTLEELTTAQRKLVKDTVAASVSAKRDSAVLLESIKNSKAKLKEEHDIDPALITRLTNDRYDQLYNASEGLAKIKDRASKIAELDDLFGTKGAKDVEV